VAAHDYNELGCTNNVPFSKTFIHLYYASCYVWSAHNTPLTCLYGDCPLNSSPTFFMHPAMCVIRPWPCVLSPSLIALHPPFCVVSTCVVSSPTLSCQWLAKKNQYLCGRRLSSWREILVQTNFLTCRTVVWFNLISSEKNVLLSNNDIISYYSIILHCHLCIDITIFFIIWHFCQLIFGLAFVRLSNTGKTFVNEQSKISHLGHKKSHLGHKKSHIYGFLTSLGHFLDLKCGKYLL